MIRQAKIDDTNLINDIFIDVVLWMKRNYLKQWRFRDLKWGKGPFNIEDYYICFDHKNNAVGFLILTPYDVNNIWKKWNLSRSLYVYKLTVKREYAKLGYSSELIDFSKDFAIKNYYNYLCLHCQAKRFKLRALYEKNGFICIGEDVIKNEKELSSFYICEMK